MPDTDSAALRASANLDSPLRDGAGMPEAADQVLLAKVRALEYIAGPVQHELANPLNALMLFGTMVRLEGGIPADMAGEIPAVADAAERAYRLARTMLELTRSRPYTPQPIRLSTLTDEIVELLGYLLTDVRVVIDVPPALPDVEADPGNLRLALVLVMVNAIRALGGRQARGSLRLTGHVTEDGRAVDLVVADSTAPLTQDELAHLFDTRARDVDAGRADGDLAAARHLLRMDGGDVRFETGVDGANRLVLVIPQMGRSDAGVVPAGTVRVAGPAEPPVAVPPTPEAGQALAGGRAGPHAATGRAVDPDVVTVLVCDDEDSIRALIVRVLERAGMRALEAGSGHEALAVLATERVALVMADHNMAEMTGIDLYLAATRTQPDLAQRFVLMSGDATDTDLVAFATEHHLRVLAKPFDLALVPRLAREVVAG